MKSALERKKPKKKKPLGRAVPKHKQTTTRETDYSVKPSKVKKEGPLEKKPKKKKKLGRVSPKHSPTSSRETNYSVKPNKVKKTGPIKKKMDSSAAANQLKELGNPTKKIGDKIKAKIKSIGSKKKKPVGRVSPKHSPSTSRETDYSQKPGKPKKTGPVKKTVARVARDYAANAAYDAEHGYKKEAKFEKKKLMHVVNRIAGSKNR